ncbi:hypothetical protein LTR97_010599 [Elasticomyces elasticus]|uniref:Uncharacterized protein n=1 Tax=Elasticomyces elasticus TaxID=574655 RepID=A0AAN8A0Q3_9PEZI|nr:hypothetical protein LTR97_010599 [Elasticomyces elasticus]
MVPSSQPIAEPPNNQSPQNHPLHPVLQQIINSNWRVPPNFRTRQTSDAERDLLLNQYKQEGENVPIIGQSGNPIIRGFQCPTYFDTQVHLVLDGELLQLLEGPDHELEGPLVKAQAKLDQKPVIAYCWMQHVADGGVDVQGFRAWMTARQQQLREEDTTLRISNSYCRA